MTLRKKEIVINQFEKQQVTYDDENDVASIEIISQIPPIGSKEYHKWQRKQKWKPLIDNLFPEGSGFLPGTAMICGWGFFAYAITTGNSGALAVAFLHMFIGYTCLSTCLQKK